MGSGDGLRPSWGPGEGPTTPGPGGRCTSHYRGGGVLLSGLTDSGVCVVKSEASEVKEV